MRWWRALRRSLDSLPRGQRRFAVIGSAVVLFWLVLSFAVALSGFVGAATRPKSSLVSNAPHYPGASGEVERFDNGFLSGERHYTAQTPDRPDVVRAYYRTLLVADGWRPDTDGRSYSKGPCPTGVLYVGARSGQDGQTTIQLDLLMPGSVFMRGFCR